MPITLSSWEKKYMMAMINVTVVVFLIGTYILSTEAITSKPLEERVQIGFFFYSFIAMLAWTPFIPLIGKASTDERAIPKVLFINIGIKMALIVVFEMIDATFAANFANTRAFFPGFADFNFQFLYAGNFLEHRPTLYAVIPGHASVEVYYPPGVAIVYVFLAFINPAKNALIYRWVIVSFETGVLYLIWKIASLPRLNVSPLYRVKGVVYASFGANILSAIDVFGKYDIILLFISLLAVYFYLEDKPFVSGAIMAFAGFVKLFPFIWMAGIAIFHLKRKQYKILLKYLAGGVMSGSAILLVSIMQEGTRLFDLLLGFRFQLIEGAYAIYMMNFWFYLAYTGLPFMNMIPYVLMGVSLLYFFVWSNKSIDVSFFIKTTAILLIFYTAVNSLYINFIFPFMCIGLLSSIKKIRVLACLEISCMLIEAVFNVIIYGSGLGDTLILELDTYPPAWYLAFRFTNLGLFMLMLVMLVIPERFSRWFPLDPESFTMLDSKSTQIFCTTR